MYIMMIEHMMNIREVGTARISREVGEMSDMGKEIGGSKLGNKILSRDKDRSIIILVMPISIKGEDIGYLDFIFLFHII